MSTGFVILKGFVKIIYCYQRSFKPSFQKNHILLFICYKTVEEHYMFAKSSSFFGNKPFPYIHI